MWKGGISEILAMMPQLKGTSDGNFKSNFMNYSLEIAYYNRHPCNNKIFAHPKT